MVKEVTSMRTVIWHDQSSKTVKQRLKDADETRGMMQNNNNTVTCDALCASMGPDRQPCPRDRMGVVHHQCRFLCIHFITSKYCNKRVIVMFDIKAY